MKIQRASVKSIISIVKALDDYKKHDSKRNVGVNEIIKYTDLAKGTVNKAIVCSKTLNLLEESSEGLHLKDLGNQLATLANSQRSNLIGKILLDFKPFIFYCSKIASGDTVERAIKRMMQIFDIEGAPNEIAYTFKSLGVFSGLLDKKGALNETIKYKEEVLSDVIVDFKDSLKNEAEVKIFLMDKLSSDLYSFLPEDGLNNLILSISKCKTHPDDAVSNSVQSLEIFLKKIANHTSITINSNHGAGQLASTLRSRNIIDGKHVNICIALSTIRNMTDHGNIPDWVIFLDTGIISIILTISTIKSVYEFVFNNKYVL